MLCEFDIQDKVFSITTDNAKNMVRCVVILQKNDWLKDIIHVKCGAHVINLVVSTMLTFLETHRKRRKGSVNSQKGI